MYFLVFSPSSIITKYVCEVTKFVYRALFVILYKMMCKCDTIHEIKQIALGHIPLYFQYTKRKKNFLSHYMFQIFIHEPSDRRRRRTKGHSWSHSSKKSLPSMFFINYFTCIDQSCIPVPHLCLELSFDDIERITHSSTSCSCCCTSKNMI